MKLFVLVSAIAALAVPVATGALAAPAATTLTGTDGPGFTITLTQGGKKVTKLKAGAYTININDKSNVHNFHLVGPGVNKKTSVTAVTKTIWKVTLKKGTYKFVCDPHATIMKGSFTVT
jgi:plastocyanin